MNILRLIVSIIIPPLRVSWQVGLTGQFWQNVILTLIGYIPGPRGVHNLYPGLAASTPGPATQGDGSRCVENL